MVEPRFQYGIWNLLLLVACIALVLGAACGSLARVLLVGAAAGLVLTGLPAACLGAFAGVICPAALGGGRTVLGCPLRMRQLLFERRMARLRPGQSSQRVRGLLGSPQRVDGFGDRVYWSYRIAGRRYMVSLDPRNLVATYSGGLARDLQSVCP